MSKHNKGSDPCSEYLSDREFLEHMIPHHQVAIDMSKLLLKHTCNPNIIYLCRNIIFKQEDEIGLMHNILDSEIPNISDGLTHMNIKKKSFLEVYYPKLSEDKNAKCKKEFFDSSHMNHMLGKKITDKEYLEHMIPHHQVAVDMCNRLLKHTKKPSLMNFCNNIILNQQYEIWVMKQALTDSNCFNSPIL